MNIFAIILLLVNLGLMLVLYLAIRRNFSQNKYADNMRKEVDKMITQIQYETENCVTILEDKISTANEAIKLAEKRLELVNKELSKKENEVVVLDKLMTKNSKKAKRDKEKKEETIKIYSDNPLAHKNMFNEQVLNMHKEGFSIGEISKETGVPTGEIELIISLGQ